MGVKSFLPGQTGPASADLWLRPIGETPFHSPSDHAAGAPAAPGLPARIALRDRNVIPPRRSSVDLYGPQAGGQPGKTWSRRMGVPSRHTPPRQQPCDAAQRLSLGPVKGNPDDGQTARAT